MIILSSVRMESAFFFFALWPLWIWHLLIRSNFTNTLHNYSPCVNTDCSESETVWAGGEIPSSLWSAHFAMREARLCLTGWIRAVWFHWLPWAMKPESAVRRCDGVQHRFGLMKIGVGDDCCWFSILSASTAGHPAGVTTRKPRLHRWSAESTPALNSAPEQRSWAQTSVWWNIPNRHDENMSELICVRVAVVRLR